METKNTFKKYQYLFTKLASALLLGCALIASSAQAITDEDWFALGLGTNGTVHATFWNGTDLYIGGDFSAVYNPDQTPVTANHVAKWDGSNWSALDSGTDGIVYALAWDGSNLYVGGDFTAAGSVSTNDIAKWDGSGWSTFGGTNDYSYVKALAWGGSNLYAGGSFTTIGGVSANYIAWWNGSNWSTLGLGTYHPVVALAWDGNNLYAGGRTLDKWNGSSWSNLGLPGIRVLAWDGSNLYAGGDFNTGWGISENYIAKWNGSSWSSLGTGMNNPVNALAWDGSTLYVGGNFTTAGGVSANRIAQWDGSSWSALGSGTDNSVNALVWDGSNLYTGGDFIFAGGNPTNYIAKACTSNAPDPFSFTDAVDEDLGVEVYSDTITVSGLCKSADISILGGEYSINGGGYTATSSSVNNEDIVTVRNTSSTSGLTPVDAVLTIGGISDTFTIITAMRDGIPNPFYWDTVIGVELSTEIVTEPRLIEGINTSVDFYTITWINGAPQRNADPITITYADGSGSCTTTASTDCSARNGDTIFLTQTSAANFSWYQTTFVYADGAPMTTFTTQTKAE